MLNMLIVLSLFSAQSQPAAAAKAQCKMAVLDFEAGEGVSDKRAVDLTDVVTTEIGTVSGCQVLSRSEIRAMISFEAQKQLLGCGDESCLAELGGALGVDLLVAGRIAKMGESTLISVRKINLKTLQVEQRVTDTFGGKDDEVVAFARWMGRRLVMPADQAGEKPKVRPKVATSQPAGIHYVEKKSTIWRTGAWAGLVATAVAALATTGAGVGTLVIDSYALPEAIKTPGDTTQAVADLESAGTTLASGMNLGLYITAGLAVVTAVLFFLPAEEIEVETIDSGPETKDHNTQATDGAA